MYQAIIVAAVIGILAYIMLMLMFPNIFSKNKSEHTRNSLLRIMDETQTIGGVIQEDEFLRDDLDSSSSLGLIASIPFIGARATELILQSGLGKKSGIVIIATIAIAVVLFIVMNKISSINGLILIIASVAGSIWVMYKYLFSRVRKRINLFIDMFPDVLDMIVRSVKSGFPLNTAIKLIAENMEPPVSTEFQQVSDEVALGRPLNHSLARLAERIPEQDIKFFVVVLNVQQETGGNLAEVIGNLSGIIRKRKHLRMKIKAMTSEARATGWILGSLPIVLFAVLWFMSPGHLEPLFEPSGLPWLYGCLGLIVSAFVIIRKMIDIDI